MRHYVKWMSVSRARRVAGRLKKEVSPKLGVNVLIRTRKSRRCRNHIPRWPRVVGRRSRSWASRRAPSFQRMRSLLRLPPSAAEALGLRNPQDTGKSALNSAPLSDARRPPNALSMRRRPKRGAFTWIGNQVQTVSRTPRGLPFLARHRSSCPLVECCYASSALGTPCVSRRTKWARFMICGTSLWSGRGW